ncbi:VOC family protein [Cellulomonas sp. zg-ZUI199]|uniref:VOC family protein n=1 Tax=Cellulomonas wangleii TaxID=2816956 RepID=A0ABX8D0S5_9CELL|nr:VOC family protein [Cellulomonas wangleii]MBO0925446.1 VOC family protein [Cellulomonas wangleii]QVI61078.1 VOC family protein [Cellulomonas wangleii]
MELTIGMVTVDTHDPQALAAWWAQRTGGSVQAHGDDFAVVVRPDGGRPALGFQKVDVPTPGKNRVHLDLEAPDAQAAVAELVAAGATRVADHGEPDGFSWAVLADPHGNQFCVSTVHTG